MKLERSRLLTKISRRLSIWCPSSHTPTTCPLYPPGTCLGSCKCPQMIRRPIINWILKRYPRLWPLTWLAKLPRTSRHPRTHCRMQQPLRRRFPSIPIASVPSFLPPQPENAPKHFSKLPSASPQQYKRSIPLTTTFAVLLLNLFSFLPLINTLSIYLIICTSSILS